MMPRLIKVRAYRALGIRNLLRVFLYRVRLKLGMHPAQRLRWSLAPGPFFAPCKLDALPVPANPAWLDEARYFGWMRQPLAECAPAWQTNPITGVTCAGAQLPWWSIGDFDPALGDIKLVWEASRFDWVISLAQSARNGRPEKLDRLNAWLSDWCAGNAGYAGANWKCGQEASIRVMHLAAAALILGQERELTGALHDLLCLHLRRIEPTLSYAMAQDNNHGSSEAAALFIGGCWLQMAGHDGVAARRWREDGRRWLEDRCKRLIAVDGSFSQHSSNYHRLMLDSCSLVEIWRLRSGQAAFSPVVVERLCAATLWLYAMTDHTSGDVPNIGANDGARLLPISASDYRDYRPAVQLAAALFNKATAYDEPGCWDAGLLWFGIAKPSASLAPMGSTLFDAGGYALLVHGAARTVLRYPRFRFRPAHADALHVDFWLGPQNILRDAGTFSYNADPALQGYFPGTAAHNTVQFDGRDQMPRVSRFLFGEWLQTCQRSELSHSGGAQSFSAAYIDAQGCQHQRQVSLDEGKLVVRDSVAGFAHSAVLRWRLAPGNWQLHGDVAANGPMRLRITASVPIRGMRIIEGWESRYYYQKTALPVLEVEIDQNGELFTELTWEL